MHNSGRRTLTNQNGFASAENLFIGSRGGACWFYRVSDSVSCFGGRGTDVWLYVGFVPVEILFLDWAAYGWSYGGFDLVEILPLSWDVYVWSYGCLAGSFQLRSCSWSGERTSAARPGRRLNCTTRVDRSATWSGTRLSGRFSTHSPGNPFRGVSWEGGVVSFAVMSEIHLVALRCIELYY